MIILVVIAAVSIVVILSFFNTSARDLGSIEVNDKSDFTGDAIIKDTEKTFYVKALDTKGKPLSGVTITATGPNGAIGSGETDSKGVASITLSVAPTLAANVDFGEVTVTAKYSGSIEGKKIATVTVQNA